MGRRIKTMATTFEAGELDERLWHRTNMEAVAAGCRRLRNWAIVTGGAVTRRPGSWWRADVEADATRIERVNLVGAPDLALVFSPTQIDIIDESDFSTEDTVTSCPWATADIPTLQYAIFDTTVQVVSHAFWMRKLDRDSAGAWTLRSLSSPSGFPAYFDISPDGEFFAPFKKLAPYNYTLTPGALTGSTTMELGPGAVSWFTADHAPNGLLRYHKRQILISVVTDGDTATGGAIGGKGLYPTHDLTVGSTTGFAVGDPLEGDTTGAQATVSSIIDATSMGVIYEGYPPSAASSMFDTTTPERIVGPTAATTASASANITPEASLQWDEAVISDFAGYAGGCILHKGRNFLFDFPTLPSWIAGSVVNEPFNFDEGAAELTDAVLDGIGDNQSTRIRYAVSAEQLLLLTTNGPYFIGESTDLPIAQTTINFNRIGSIPVGDCAPIFVDEGVVVAHGTHIHALVPTGNIRRPWEVGELAELASHLISDPSKLAFCEGLGGSVSRYLFCRNDDSTLAVFRIQRDSQVGGWALWYTGDDATDSGFIDIAARGDSLLALADLGADRRLVEFDFDAVLDGQRDYSAAISGYANETGLVLIKNNVKLYDGSMNGSGKFVRSDTSEVVEPASGYYVGWDYETEFSPMPPTDASLGALDVSVQQCRPRLINTQRVECDGVPMLSTDGYADTVDPADILPIRSWTPESYDSWDSGEDGMVEPAIVFGQTEAAQCTISALSWRVSYGSE